MACQNEQIAHLQRDGAAASHARAATKIIVPSASGNSCSLRSGSREIAHYIHIAAPLNGANRFARANRNGRWIAFEHRIEQLRAQTNELRHLLIGLHVRSFLEITVRLRARFGASFCAFVDRWREFIIATIVIAKRPIDVLIFREIVAKFVILIEHVRTIEQHIESNIQRHAMAANGFVGFHCAVAILFGFEEVALLVVAVAVGYIAVAFVGTVGIESIAIFEPAHGGLTVGIVQPATASPAHHALVHERGCGWIAAPVFLNEIGIARGSFHRRIIFRKICAKRVAVCSTKAVRQVHAVAIDFVLGEPVLQRTLKHGFGRFEIVVPILVNIVAVRRCNIEPRIVLQIIAIGIEFVHWVQSSGVVEHHIQYHRNAAFVALVDERFQVVFAAVGLIGRKIVVRTVAPVVVTVEFGYRHQFEGVYSKIFEIIQAVYHTFVRAIGCEIIDPHFVDYKVIFVGAFEIECGIAPSKFWLIGLNNRHITIGFRRIFAQRWVNCSRLVLIIGMKHFFGIQVVDAHHFAIVAHHHVLISVLLARRQAINFNPEIVAIAFHLIFVRHRPIVEIAHDKHILRWRSLAGGVGAERNFGGIVGVVVVTIVDAAWARGRDGSGWNGGRCAIGGRFGSRLSDKHKFVIARVRERGGVGHLRASGCLHRCAVLRECERGTAGGVASERYRSAFRADFAK